MKKILLYTDTPQVGGAEVQMFLLAKFLNKENFTPILACSNYSQLDKWCENFKKENIEVIRLKVSHKHDPRHYFQLKKITKEREIDLIHAHVWNPASCRYAFSAAKSAKIPIIITEHDPFELSFFKNFFKKRSLKNVSKIITVSDANKKLITKFFPQYKNKIETIHNGIDITWWQSQILRFTPEERKTIKEEKFLAKENTLIIMTIAELHERKGLKYLIQAIPEVVEKFPNIKLAIVGDGKERKNLESLSQKLNIERHIIFLGKQKEIPQLLKSSDIFVLPSVREAFGFVNLEAMIIGLPVLATNVGGIPEIIDDGKTGIIVPTKNSAALSNTLLDLISQPKKRSKMALEGQKKVIEKFDAKTMAEKYEKIYLKIS